MKLTTLNLQGFTDWHQREPKIVEYLKRESPDAIFFQEAVFLPELSPYNQAQLVNKSLRYLFEHSTITRLQVGKDYPTYREGLTVLSKTPVVKTDAIILKKAPADEHNRIVQLIDIFVDGHTIKFANVHFSITDVTDFATAHLRETLEILQMRGETRIIIGDFNLSTLEGSKELWDKSYVSSEQTPYITYPSMNKRTDYVLLPKNYSFQNSSVSDDSLSDHRALTVIVNV